MKVKIDTKCKIHIYITWGGTMNLFFCIFASSFYDMHVYCNQMKSEFYIIWKWYESIKQVNLFCFMIHTLSFSKWCHLSLRRNRCCRALRAATSLVLTDTPNVCIGDVRDFEGLQQLILNTCSGWLHDVPHVLSNNYWIIILLLLLGRTHRTALFGSLSRPALPTWYYIVFNL